SIPGNLHLVLVLRPKSQSQGTGTDLGFRFCQEDFTIKMPVIMLSSVTDLLRYIDENHLSADFSGTLECCSTDWIVLRTAIESFAVMVKDVAQLLQVFGTELAETELPEEPNAIEYLLHSHTDKYRQMKNDIRSVIKEGRQILSNLEGVKRTEDRDIAQDRDTVQRLLTQLRDMEMAFDGFFEKHHLKMQQYLQLLRYELSFHEMEEKLEALVSREKAIPAAGVTAAQTQQLITDLHTLDSIAEEEMGHAQIVILHGHQLAASHHYALALIVQRCNELRHHCDTLTTALRIKHTSLTHTHTLQLHLEQVVGWCDESVYLLAGQMVDKFQSKEGAQEALNDIERLLETKPTLSFTTDKHTPEIQAQVRAVMEKFSSVQVMLENRQACLRKITCVQVRPIQPVSPRPESPTRLRSPLFSPKHSTPSSPSSSSSLLLIELYSVTVHVMKELIDTEKVYEEELLSVLLGYRAEMDNPSLSHILPSELKDKKEVLFGNLPEIYKFHSRIFVQDLESCRETPERVGARFLERKENFQVYERYCQNKPRSEAMWRQCADSPFFQECKRKLKHKLDLDSYLLKPVQRLTKYQLLLKELLKHSTQSEYACELQGALNAMLDLLKSVNDSMHQIAITGYEGDLCDLGRVLMQGSFSVWMSRKSSRVKDMARFKPMQRHLFLHERALLFCKKREENGDGAERTASYSFKHCLRMSAVGITENIKGDVKKFELWYSGREEVYVVQAPTAEVKSAWLSEIRKILTRHQKTERASVCMSWSPAPIVSCSGCFDVVPHSKGAPMHSDESGSSSPVLTDPVMFSPR
ncbi:proto-oncogene DBL-like isoform X4, partial [Silurus asotus]